jgi:hypothetical protein
MSSDGENWLTAAEAARILHMSDRQVNRYGAEGKIRTRRAGRRVLYLASDVGMLADELRVDIRPAPQRSSALLPPELVRHLQEQADLMRQQGETQASIDRRLAEIERQLQTLPRMVLPTWLIGLIAVLVVLSVIIVILLVIR